MSHSYVGKAPGSQTGTLSCFFLQGPIDGYVARLKGSHGCVGLSLRMLGSSSFTHIVASCTYCQITETDVANNYDLVREYLMNLPDAADNHHVLKLPELKHHVAGGLPIDRNSNRRPLWPSTSLFPALLRQHSFWCPSHTICTLQRFAIGEARAK